MVNFTDYGLVRRTKFSNIHYWVVQLQGSYEVKVKLFSFDQNQCLSYPLTDVAGSPSYLKYTIMCPDSTFYRLKTVS
jgi:hypothetical protein